MNLQINQITINSNRRLLGEVTELAKSIDSLGLMNPISVTKDFVLIAGLHRLEACKSLGWQEIPVTVFDYDQITAQLAEIDENLIRNELSALERGEQLAKRKDLYEAKFPHTKKGGDKQSVSAKGKLSADSALSFPSFVKDTSFKTKQAQRTIHESVQIAKRISEPVRNIIRETPIADNKSELLMLSRLDPSAQTHVAEKVESGKAETVTDAMRQIAKEIPEGFKSAAQVVAEHRLSAGYKWNDALSKTQIQLQSIDDLGGIIKLTEKWSYEHRSQCAEFCRQYAETLMGYAEQLERTLNDSE